MINRAQSILFTPAYIEFKVAFNASILDEIPYLTKDYVKLPGPSIQEAVFYGFTDLIRLYEVHRDMGFFMFCYIYRISW